MPWPRIWIDWRPVLTTGWIGGTTAGRAYCDVDKLRANTCRGEANAPDDVYYGSPGWASTHYADIVWQRHWCSQCMRPRSQLHGQHFSPVWLRVTIASNAPPCVAYCLRNSGVILGNTWAVCSVDQVEQSQETRSATQLIHTVICGPPPAAEQLR
jgi:hypothetical protein